MAKFAISNGVDIFEAGEGAMLQRILMLRNDAGKGGGRRNEPKNVLGDRLEVCSLEPDDGFPNSGPFLLEPAPKLHQRVG